MIIGFLRTLLVLFLIFYLFRFIGRLVMPLLISKFMNKMANPGFNQQQYSDRGKRDEGKVTVQKTVEHQKMASSDIGEYVDYEEVK